MTFKLGDSVRVAMAGSAYSGEEGTIVSSEHGTAYGYTVDLDDFGKRGFDECELELVARADPFAAPPEPDEVNSPDHYTWTKGFEVIDFAEQLNFNLGNVVKYSARAGRKTDDPIRDLEKARWYLDREIARIKKGDSE